MWGNSGAGNSGQSPYGPSSSQNQQQKHDIFVGNLAFTTTEEQLHQVFSEVGRVIKVRMVNDLDTGKPRGFAFVEFEDPQAALSAIRNMDDYELNGRKLRVNFSNSSHLETLAGQLGMDMKKKDANVTIGAGMGNAAGASAGGVPSHQSGSSGRRGGADNGTQAVSNALKNMSKGEMYDIISKLKQIADTDPDEARKIVSGHPQLPEAILFLMSQLDMIKTPLANALGVVGAGVGVGAVPPAPMPPPNMSARIDPRDPRAKMQAQRAPPPMAADPRAAPASDPRDPRARMGMVANVPPPPMPPYGNPLQQQQTHQPPPAPPMNVAGLDPGLVQQVMGLTPAQIAQLPVEKQSSILALRQQITTAMAA
eukprot:CAMPEP_0194113252 /NCGR_PEP_ID=MMETSP0150-20130528/15858_1 /TAXON_ID=122233 /ORGANISM="Chaetoceros debilis, Strain MM31A-1" /LENGTH=366 /DNA_ID=CAMNT_0038803123 /DNA_START=172 /DNA_END=1268 /DNA_ORIENTATION=-